MEEISGENINLRRKSSIQIDGSADISDQTQLIANIRHIDGDKIMTSIFFFCGKPPESATGDEIFRVIDKYVRKNVLQRDVATAITGKVTGFVAKVREVDRQIRFHSHLFHSYTTVAKTLPGVLKNMLQIY
jgi:hypothetical protein